MPEQLLTDSDVGINAKPVSDAAVGLAQPDHFADAKTAQPPVSSLTDSQLRDELDTQTARYSLKESPDTDRLTALEQESNKRLAAMGPIASAAEAAKLTFTRALPKGIGKGFGLIGKGAEALIGKVAGTGDTEADVEKAVSLGKPLPVEEAAGKLPGVRRFAAQTGLSMVGALPKIAMLSAVPGALAVRGVSLLHMGAAGGLFGLDDTGKFQPKQAAIMALFPIVGEAGSLLASKAIGRSLENGSNLFASRAAKKVMDTIGRQAAYNAYLTAADSPEIIDEYRKDPDKAMGHVASIVGQNLAWELLGIRHWRGKIPSAAEHFINEHGDQYAKAYEKTFGDAAEIPDIEERRQHLKDFFESVGYHKAGERPPPLPPEAAQPPAPTPTPPAAPIIARVRPTQPYVPPEPGPLGVIPRMEEAPIRVHYNGYNYEKRGGWWYVEGSEDPLPTGDTADSASREDRNAARFIGELERRRSDKPQTPPAPAPIISPPAEPLTTGVPDATTPRIEPQTGELSRVTPRKPVPANAPEVRQGEGASPDGGNRAEPSPKVEGQAQAADVLRLTRELQPALLVDGVPRSGGDTHDAIKDNLLSQAKSQDERNNVLMAFLDDNAHVFVDAQGKPYTRQEAATALGAKEPLHSEVLREMKDKLPPLPTPAKSGTVEPAAAPAETIIAPENGERAPEMATERGSSPPQQSAAELRARIADLTTKLRTADSKANQLRKIKSDQQAKRYERQADRLRQQLEILKGNLSVVEADALKKPRLGRGISGTTRFHSETEANGHDILAWLFDNRKLLSRSAALKRHGKEWWLENKSQWDDAPTQLALPHHNVIYSPNGSEPNKVAQTAFEAGQITEPHERALWEEIRAASAKRKGFVEDQKHQAEMLKQDQAQHEDWLNTISKKEGGIRKDAHELAPGDKMEIDGAEFVVKEVDPNTAEVVLEDGRRFGQQRLSPNATIWVEKFTEAGAEESEPAKPEAEPVAASPAGKSYEYHSPYRPVMSISQYLPKGWELVGDNNFRLNRPLTGKEIEQWQLEPLDPNDPINIRKRYNQFREELMDKIDPESGAKIVLKDGRTLLLSDNIDPASKDKYPFRITNIAAAGMPTGHMTYTDWDEVVRSIWGERDNIVSIERGKESAAAPAAKPAARPAGGELFSADEIPFNLSGETARAPAPKPAKPAPADQAGLFAQPPAPAAPAAPEPPPKPAVEVRPLTKAEQREFHDLSMKLRRQREEGGEALTTAETQRYEHLTALAGQMDLLAEPAPKVPADIKPGDRVRWVPNKGVRNFGPVEGVVQDVINEGDGIHIQSDDANIGVQRRWMEDGHLEKVEAAKPEAPWTKELWQITRAELGENRELLRPKFGVVSDTMHRDAVSQALAEGKPVPPEVLKDYPQLAPKPAAAPESPAKPTKFGGTTPDGTSVNGYERQNGRWFKLNDEGKIPERAIPANDKQHQQLEAAASAPPAPAETRSPVEILSQASSVRVKLPEGATQVRITDVNGKKAQEHIADVNKGSNPFQGVDVVKIEAGTINRDKKFQVVPGEVTVIDAGKKPKSSLSDPEHERPGELKNAIPDPIADRAVEQLRKQLVEEYGRSPDADLRAQGIRRVSPNRSDLPLDGVSGRERVGADTWTALESAFGQKIIFLDLGENPLVRFNGIVFDNVPGIIFLNARARSPLLSLFGHEFLHDLRNTNEQLYLEMVAKLEPLIKGFPKFWADLTHTYWVNRLRTPTADRAKEELVSNFFGDSFSDPAFWSKLSQREPSLFKKVATAVVGWLKSLAQKLNPLGSYEHFSDIGKAQAIISDAIAEHAKRERPLGGESESKLKYSLARTPDDIERRRLYEDIGWRAALVGGYYHLYEVQRRHAENLSISPEAQARDQMNRNGDMTRIGLDESGRTNYYDARDNAASFGERQEVVLDAFESVTRYQWLGIRNQQKLEKISAMVNSPAFRNKIERLSLVDERKELHEQTKRVFLNQVVGAAGRITNMMERQRMVGVGIEQLGEDLKRVQALPDFQEAVQQITDRIVNTVAADDQGISLLAGGGRPDGSDILNRYFALAPEEIHVGADRHTALQLSAAILATNRDLRNGLTSLALLSRDISLQTEVNEAGRRIATELINNPAKALPRIAGRAANLATKATRAEAIWLNLHRDVRRALHEYEVASDAVRLHEAVTGDAEWKQYVRDVMRDNGGVSLTDDELRRLVAEKKAGEGDPIDKVFFKAAGNQILHSPTGIEYRVDMGWTPDSVQKSQETLGRLSSDIAAWLDDPANADNPSRELWENRHTLIQHVLMSAAVWNPNSIKMILGSGSWGMPEVFFQGLSMPSGKIAFLSFQNFSRWFNQAKGWFTDWKDISRRAADKATYSHGFNELEFGEYRQAIFDQIAFRYRNGREVMAGDWINGHQVTRQDMDLFYSQGKMFAEAYDRLKRTSEFAGVKEVMEDPRIIDEFESGAFGIRMAQQRGLHRDTTLPRGFSEHGRALSRAIHMMVEKRDQALHDLPQKAVDMTEEQVAYERAEIHRKFQYDLMQYLNDPNRATYFVAGSFISNRTSNIHRTPSEFEATYNSIRDLWEANDPNKPQTMEEVVDYLTENQPLVEGREPYTYAQVQTMFLNEITGMAERFHKNFGGDSASMGQAYSDPTRKTSFTEATKGEIFPAYFYQFGAMDAGELRGYSLDMGMFGFRRAMESLTALRADMENSIAEMKSGVTMGKWRAEQQRVSKESYRAGEDFRDLQKMEDKLAELDRFIKGLPIWAGHNMIQAEGLRLGLAQRLLSDAIQAALSGPRTLLRISGATMGGSTIKMGQVLWQSGFGRIRAYPAAALSAVTSMLRFGTSTAIGWYHPDAHKFVPGVPATLVRNIPRAAKAFFRERGRERILSAVEAELADSTDAIYAALHFWHDQKALGMTPNNPIGARISTLLADPITKGGIYDVQQRESKTGKVAQALSKYLFYGPLATGEAGLELIATRFPTGGYNVTYDAVGRMASWYVDTLWANARRTFDTYEKLGRLGEFNFDNLSDPKNSLVPWQVLPSFWSKIGVHDQGKIPGWLRPNSNNLQLARELFYLNTPRDLQDLVISYWGRLAQTAPEQRNNVEFLAPEEMDAAAATQKANARFRGIASRFVEQTHHATPLNRPYQLQKNTGFAAILPFAGWSSQTLKQFAVYWGKVAAPFGKEGEKFDSHIGLLAAGLVSALGFVIFSGAGGDLEARALRLWDRLVNKKNTQLKTIDEAQGPTEAAEIAIHDITAVMPLANSTFNSLLGASGYRGTYGFQAFGFDKLNAFLNYARGVVRTHDITYGLDRLAEAQVPFTESVIENVFNRQGFQNSRNSVRALQKQGPPELVERRASASVSLPSELTPYRAALAEAVFSGRAENVTKAAADFVQKATELGRSEPDKVLAQVFSTLNPYRQAFGGVLTEQQRTDTLARMGDYERNAVQKAESNYSAAANQLGFSANFTKEDAEAGRAAGRGTVSAAPSSGAIPSSVSSGRLPMGRGTTLSGRGRRFSLGTTRSGLRGVSTRLRSKRLVSGKLSPRSGRLRLAGTRLRGHRKLSYA